MRSTKNGNVKAGKRAQNFAPIVKSLSRNQKEIIKLLQKKEVLITHEKGILITCGNDIKKVTFPSFYKLVNRGLVFHPVKQPHNYVLSRIGKTIKV